ncbi:MAG TPA: DUF1385 domain-containing protein [Actinomycetota bacterium]|jgi:uncharacterized protein YqhQ|nr:DUF1385 domain-containing protein [Actinomycetota bacterium]
MPQEHYYGGQAVLEGVMMRGRDVWAVAVRRPDASIHLESHRIESIAERWPILRKPGLRGIIALGQALRIGVKALTISANQSVEEEEKLTPRQMAVSMVVAFTIFIAVFIVGPTVLFRYAQRQVPSGILLNAAEGVFRVLLFLGYLWLIGRMREIRRVFEYHGAEHKTIAAYEHGEELDPERVDQFSTLHVRCGTNFLLIVMVLTIFVFAFFGTPTLPWRIASRIVAIPIIAGLAFEALRLGARYSTSTVMRALMAPGLWLQKITTQPPSLTQIEVAIASFNEVLRREREVGAGGPAASPAPPVAEAAAEPAAGPIEPERPDGPA